MSSESTVRVLPHPHCSLYSYFSISVQFCSDVPLIFCQHTIHQVIWPSPGLPVPSRAAWMRSGERSRIFIPRSSNIRSALLLLCFIRISSLACSKICFPKPAVDYHIIQDEGTGTWPDYLVNRDDQKNEGPFGEKNCTKIEK